MTKPDILLPKHLLNDLENDILRKNEVLEQIAKEGVKQKREIRTLSGQWPNTGVMLSSGI